MERETNAADAKMRQPTHVDEAAKQLVALRMFDKFSLHLSPALLYTLTASCMRRLCLALTG